MKSNSFISTISFAFSFCRGNHLLFICYVLILCYANHPFYFTLNHPKLLNCLFLDAEIFIFYPSPSHWALFRHLFSSIFLYLDANTLISLLHPAHFPNFTLHSIIQANLRNTKIPRNPSKSQEYNIILLNNGATFIQMSPQLLT